MATDTERREVARRLLAVAKKLGPNMDAHEFAHYTADVLDVGESMTWYEMELRLADLIKPPYPDATASYKGWRVEVYDPDGVLVSPSNVAADLVRAHADGKGPSEPEVRCVAVVKVDGERLEKLVHDAVVKLTGIDRDELLSLVDEMDTHWLGHEGMEDSLVARWARELREALGESDG